MLHQKVKLNGYQFLVYDLLNIFESAAHMWSEHLVLFQKNISVTIPGGNQDQKNAVRQSG